MIPARWRKMNESDECCSVSDNLKQGLDMDGSIIDGGWICSICGRHWVGKGKDKLLDHELETLTDFGEKFIKAMDDVIREERHLELNVVLGRMVLKGDLTPEEMRLM